MILTIDHTFAMSMRVTRSVKNRGRGLFLAVTSTLLVFGAATARADIAFLDSFKNLTNEQTGNGNSLTFNGAFYSADLNTTVPNSYTSVTMTYPGPGSPLNIPQATTTNYHYQTGLLSKATMDADFPFGTYTFTGATGGPPDVASYDYTSDDYATSLPYLTGTDYSSLQGVNPAAAFTLHFNPFTGFNTSNSFIFVSVYNETTSTTVFNDGFLSPSTTSVTIPAGTFTPGDQYDYEIDFSNRLSIPSPGASNEAQLGFDVRTDGLFTAGSSVPEPATITLCALGLTVLVRKNRMRK